jgi:hypothetical protein
MLIVLGLIVFGAAVRLGFVAMELARAVPRRNEDFGLL